jgi:hypothetical protein
MTQASEPSDRRIVDLWSTVGNRQLRTISRRVNRLEDTRVTWGELNVEFVGQRPAFGNRLYDEVDDLKKEMNQRFDSLESKFDLIMRHITGQDNE